MARSLSCFLLVAAALSPLGCAAPPPPAAQAPAPPSASSSAASPWPSAPPLAAASSAPAAPPPAPEPSPETAGPKVIEADEDDPRARFRVPVGGSPVDGKADALVTVVMFGGYQDPFSKRALPTLEQVKKRYGDDVRVVWKDAPLPFHQHSQPSARLAREAQAKGGAKKFWQAHKALFDSSPKLERADLLAVAKKLGIAAKRANEAMDGPSPAIEEDLALGTALGVQGTPAFFVNGRRLFGAQPFEKFQEVIDQSLAEARGLVASGVDRASVYETLQRDAATAVRRNQRPRLGNPGAGAGGGGAQAPGAAPGEERVEAQHLLVMFKGSQRAPSSITRSRDQAFARVREALTKAHAGTPFSQLVREYSDEPGASDRVPPGGLGSFRRGMMVKAFENAAFALSPGQLSDIVETEFGFHIILRTK